MAWYRRFWNVLRPGRMQSDLQRELSFHVAERAEELEVEVHVVDQDREVMRLVPGGDRLIERRDVGDEADLVDHRSGGPRP